MSGNSKTDADVSEPGLPALIRRLNRFWLLDKYTPKADCDVLDDPREFLTSLAIPLDKANELWGYGVVVEGMAVEAPEPAANVARVLAKDRSPTWTGERLKKQQELFQAEGKRNFAMLTAQQAGLDVRESNRRVRAYLDSLISKPVNSVFHLANKKGKPSRPVAD